MVVKQFSMAGNNSEIKRVFLLLHAKSGGFLALKRADDQTWGLPGGKVEEGETPEEALYREVKQEIDFTPELMEESYRFEAARDVGCSVYVAVTPRIFRPKLNKESLAVQWKALGKWPKPAHPQMARVIAENSEGFKRHAVALASRL